MPEQEEKDIVVEFSGWCRIKAKRVSFQYTGEDDDTTYIITGEEYLNLSEKAREDYILKNVLVAIRNCDDMEWTSIDVIDED
jgi:hypothetical protein